MKPILYEGVVYPSTENAYQAAKSFFPEGRLEFVDATPKKAKQLGKKLKLRANWDKIKFQIMYEVCEEKFKDGIERELLLQTGDKYLIEGNYWCDQNFGICFGPDFKTMDQFALMRKCPKCGGGGKNALGKILMDIREKLNNK